MRTILKQFALLIFLILPSCAVYDAETGGETSTTAKLMTNASETTTIVSETTMNVTETTTAASAVLTSAVTAASEETSPAGGQFRDDLAYEILDLVNAERQNNGLSRVEWSDELAYTAKVRVVELRYSWSHERPDGRSWMTSITDAGITAFVYAGENLAYAEPGKRPDWYNAERVMKDWMNSPSHRECILNPEYDFMGIACYEINEYRYWVQHFGAV